MAKQLAEEVSGVSFLAVAHLLRGPFVNACQLPPCFVGADRSVSAGAPSDRKARNTSSKLTSFGPFIPSFSATSNSLASYSHRRRMFIFCSRKLIADNDFVRC